MSAGRPLAAPQLNDETQVRATPITDPYLFCQAWKARARKLKIEIERTESALETATGSQRKALQRRLKQLRKELRRAKLEMARWCR